MKVLIHVFALLAGTALYLAMPKLAGAECTTQYGGTVSCPPTDLTINKLVAKPRDVQVVETKGGVKQEVVTGSLDYKDNLGIEDAHAPGQEIVFKLVVHNNSTKAFTNVRVVDKIPDFVKLDSYPGTIEDNGKTLVFYLDRLGVGETREQELFGHIVAKDQISGPDNFCELNRGEVSAEDRAHNDTAQFCISKTKPAKKLPVTGVEEYLMLIPFIGAGLSGLTLLRKKG